MIFLAWATGWAPWLSGCWVPDLVALKRLLKVLMMVFAWVTGWAASLAGCWIPDLVVILYSSRPCLSQSPCFC
jgi:hypothetical protein